MEQKILDTILDKMCTIVGADYKKIDFKEEGWFKKYTWTTEQEEEFRDWFLAYLISNKDARACVMPFPSKQLKFVRGVVADFINQYGWMNAPDRKTE